MGRLYFDEVTVKIFRKGYEDEEKYWLEIKGKERERDGIKSKLIKRKEIQKGNYKKEQREIKETLYSKYGKIYQTDEFGINIKWRMKWVEFLNVRLMLQIGENELYEKYFEGLKVIENE